MTPSRSSLPQANQATQMCHARRLTDAIRGPRKCVCASRRVDAREIVVLSFRPVNGSTQQDKKHGGGRWMTHVRSCATPTRAPFLSGNSDDLTFVRPTASHQQFDNEPVQQAAKRALRAAGRRRETRVRHPRDGAAARSLPCRSSRKSVICTRSFVPIPQSVHLSPPTTDLRCGSPP